MTAAPSLAWLSRLTSALSGEITDDTLPKALVILAEIGVRAGEHRETPWLRLSADETELVLVAATVVEPELRDLSDFKR